MANMILLVRQLQAGDQVFDCRKKESQSEAFKTLQTFFGKGVVQFDNYTFWFVNSEGQKVGLDENDGILNKCTIGLFQSFKRAVIVQLNGEESITTEFYVEPKKGDLMVHRYRGRERTNENYKIAGYQN